MRREERPACAKELRAAGFIQILAANLQICALFANNMLNIQQVLQTHCPPEASLNRRRYPGYRVPICFVIVCTANNEKIKGEKKLNRGNTVMCSGRTARGFCL